MTHPLRLLLGPQRPTVNLGTAIARADFGAGPMAVISAAWQEAEGDIDDIRHVLGRSLLDLGLYQRSEAVFAADESLRAAYRQRQDSLIEQQRLYRLRLRQLTIAARAILRVKGTGSAIVEERRHAISQLRALDRHHLRQIRKLNTAFEEAYSVDNNKQLAQQQSEIAEVLSRCESVLITGGNVVVLMNRLQLFGMRKLLAERNIIAWSAGAMVLSDKIVLFHDRMPQGRRDAELMCEGLGIVTGRVFLPDARGRLRNNEPIRTGLFSRRFSPARCLTLDNGAHLLFEGAALRDCGNVRRLAPDGRFSSVGVN